MGSPPRKVTLKIMRMMRISASRTDEAETACYVQPTADMQGYSSHGNACCNLEPTMQLCALALRFVRKARCQIQPMHKVTPTRIAIFLGNMNFNCLAPIDQEMPFVQTENRPMDQSAY